MFSRSITAFFVVCLVAATRGGGFLAPNPSIAASQVVTLRIATFLQMSDSEEEKLRALGYSEGELRRSKKQSDPEEIKVRVDLVDDVDPFSLTALGFALIALNFLVFANMGDGGIAGLVATFINTVKQ